MPPPSLFKRLNLPAEYASTSLSPASSSSNTTASVGTSVPQLSSPAPPQHNAAGSYLGHAASLANPPQQLTHHTSLKTSGMLPTPEEITHYKAMLRSFSRTLPDIEARAHGTAYDHLLPDGTDMVAYITLTAKAQEELEAVRALLEVIRGVLVNARLAIRAQSENPWSGSLRRVGEEARGRDQVVGPEDDVSVEGLMGALRLGEGEAEGVGKIEDLFDELSLGIDGGGSGMTG
jgi:hypothetical protein